jgi:diguanylate cyclase (GGDEF)-like protein
MKKLISVSAMILGWACMARAAAPGPLTTLHDVAALTNTQAGSQLPVAFEATAIYFNRDTKVLNVQENDLAIFVKATTNATLIPGDRVLVRGIVQPSFIPYIVSNDITFLRHGMLPASVPATFEDLVSKRLNCRLVRVQGVIRAADLVTSAVVPSGRLQLLMEGGYIDVELDSHDAGALKNLLDSEVEITGAAGRQFNGKMQETGAKIKVSSLADIKVLKRAGSSPWSLPVTPMDEIVTGTHIRDFTQRLRVHGTITYYQPGSAVVLQNGTGSLWVSTRTSEPLQIGDIADATGFPDTHDGRLTLTRAEIQDSQLQAPVQPQSATWRQLAFFGRSVLGGHEYDLVSIKGQLVTEVREAVQDEYVLVADGQEFTAIYRHPPLPRPLPTMRDVPLGATLRVTGICVPQDGQPFNDEAPFDVLLRSFDDIQVVARPSPLTPRNLMYIIGLLLAVVMVVGVRGWTLERKVRRETVTVAYLERRRRRILEDINGSRPLAEIIEEITEVVTVKLHGAPCWCQIADGATLGNAPPSLQGMRAIEERISSRSGAALGTIFAAFNVLAKPHQEEREALQMGAELATLAIETRRLYSDLVHRSEFDQLTEIQNRFSLEKHLDGMILAARESAGIFGIIYIDLDKFKQVNDLYGHQVGDVYLQQVAARMKHQLRPGDLLARLGGDEFAVLLPSVHNRSDVEEVAVRLDRCLDDPFAVGDHVLHGSASFGTAIYPVDAATRDGLLSAADAAMYAAKHIKRTNADMQAIPTDHELTSEARK